MTNLEKIQNFIVDNNLTESKKRSTYNSTFVILAGYALSLGITSIHSELAPGKQSLYELLGSPEGLRLVFNYAQKKNYGAYWSKKEAHKMYKF